MITMPQTEQVRCSPAGRLSGTSAVKASALAGRFILSRLVALTLNLTSHYPCGAYDYEHSHTQGRITDLGVEMVGTPIG